MRLSGFVLLLGAAIVGVGHAAGIAELAAQLPACGLACLGTAVAASPCTLDNSTCICTNTELLTSAAACLATSCEPKEQLQVAHIQGLGCGVPIENHQTKLKIISYFFCILAEVAICIRIWSKLQILNKLRADDCVMVLLGVLDIPFCYFLMALIDLGLGVNMWDANLDKLDLFFMYFWIEELIYISFLALVKVALLLFLVNIFPSPKFRAACWTLGGLILATSFSFQMATVFSCNPIPHFWTRWQGPAISPGTCNNLNLQTYISAALNIVQDFAILFLPIHELYKLQVSKKRKVQLFIMFSVGLFVSIISIFRLKTLVTYGETTNPTMDYIDLVIWSIIETQVAIVCACMPSIKQLLGHYASNSFFGSSAKTNPITGTTLNQSKDWRVFRSKSFKIESNKSEGFHELTNMTDATLNETQFDDHDKKQSLAKRGSAHGTLDGLEDEHVRNPYTGKSIIYS